MMSLKRKFYPLALNVLATFTLGGVVGTTFTQTAHAAPAIPLTATPEAAQASVEHWCGRDPSSFDCQQAKKHQQVVLQALSARKNQEKVQEKKQQQQDADRAVSYWCTGNNGLAYDAEKCEDAKLKVAVKSCESLSSNASKADQDKCAEVKEQSFRKDLAKNNPDSASKDENRKLLKQLRDEYLKQFQKNQEVKKEKSALENKNSALNRKNRELKNQASQSCAVASQPANTVKSNATRPEIVPVSSEIDGLTDQDTSNLNGTAK